MICKDNKKVICYRIKQALFYNYVGKNMFYTLQFLGPED